ncbi:unnamed protein product [Callosobruchus maculatus]|uniref:Palmitoyltransferase n=1 Tax=Callosobruchus maculatus TaxID=64391 RepID=A0A653CSJ9_CALMS|nr:unnamed protein product [Callosobruchus maculatus]
MTVNESQLVGECVTRTPASLPRCSCLTTHSSVNMARDKVTRKWEVFQGRNRFYCNGRLMTAPNSGVFLLTVFLITVTSTLFFIFDCKYLAENVTIAIPIIGGLLFLFTMSSLLRTGLSDPGIIPRATSEEAAYVEKQIEVTNSANSPTFRPPPRTKEVLVKGQTVKLKYCFTCKIFRPPRASHCSLCDNCVDRFDHHCPWVGNCVGRRNYRFFYMFIVSLAFLAVFIFACAVAHLILITKEDRQFLDAVKESPPSVIVAIICFFSVWSIIGLAGFHTYLTTSNQTTNEDIKGSFASKRGQDSFNPYSQGNVCLNCFHILCGPVTPSLIDRRGLVTESYSAEINRTITSEAVLASKYYGPIQNGPQHITPTSTELPGIYRQTTETTGTYHIPRDYYYEYELPLPSKNTLKAHKLIAIPRTLLPTRKQPPLSQDEAPYGFRNSCSLSQFKNMVGVEDSHNYDDFYRFYIQSWRENDRFTDFDGLRDSPVLDQSRYRDHSNKNHGQYVKHKEHKRRAKAYDSVHRDDYCLVKLNAERNLNYNVKERNFPVPNYSPIYIQQSNAGSVTHLVMSEQPLAVASSLPKASTVEDHQQFSNHSPLYNNIPLGKSLSYAENINHHCDEKMPPDITKDATADKSKLDVLKFDNDLTAAEKKNSLLSASRLRLLQDTTMIESALDLDSLDDSSLGTNSQAGLMKVV